LHRSGLENLSWLHLGGPHLRAVTLSVWYS
jgi:hypothetical protein